MTAGAQTNLSASRHDGLVTSHRADLAACLRLMRGGSHSFFVASRLLPRSAREAAVALYAFCRVADDAIDRPEPDPSNGIGIAARHAPAGRGATSGTAAASGDRLSHLHRRLDAIYAGRSLEHPADRAFAHVVRAHALPIELPRALLEGFAWDLEGRRYRSIDAVEDYAARVAGTVGAMMARIMGASQPLVLARACELGLAMQLTNIARDVGEDARAGRLYLPLDWLDEEGVDADRFLREPCFSPALGRVVARLLAHADLLYAQADTAVVALPWSCRPAIAAAARVYAEIGREIERRRLDSVSQRAVVSTSRKLMRLASALASVVAGGVQELAQSAPELARSAPWPDQSAPELARSALESHGQPGRRGFSEGAAASQEAPAECAALRPAIRHLVACTIQPRPLGHAYRDQTPALAPNVLAEGSRHRPPGRVQDQEQTRGFGRLAELFERLERLDREDRARQHPGFHRA
jgi:phytoene synthase